MEKSRSRRSDFNHSALSTRSTLSLSGWFSAVMRKYQSSDTWHFEEWLFVMSAKEEVAFYSHINWDKSIVTQNAEKCQSLNWKPELVSVCVWVCLCKTHLTSINSSHCKYGGLFFSTNGALGKCVLQVSWHIEESLLTFPSDIESLSLIVKANGKQGNRV